MQQIETPVLIVGGGWSGLAAAVELSRHNIPVTVLEAAKQTGGRARRVQFNGSNHNSTANQAASNNSLAAMPLSIDNGQHLLVGAYESTLDMLREIGVKESEVLKRTGLLLSMRSPQWKEIRFKTPNIPAPLHLLWALLSTRGLSVAERLNAVDFCRKLAKRDFTINEDESCLSLFARYRQRHKVIKALWEPLCLAGLNTHINTASAEVFLRMLRETFAHTRQDSELLLTQTDLGKLFPDPAIDFIERMGGSVQLGQRVEAIQIVQDMVAGVSLSDRSIKAQHIILATPCYTTAKLCTEHPQLQSLSLQLQQIGSNPICTVYLQYDPQTSMDEDMVGSIGTTSQWIFDRKIYGQPGLMAVVISGRGEHMNLSNDKLAQLAANEIADEFPHWPAPQQHMVIREKRATFDCSVGINKLRPGNATAIQQLWLAGDYTDTGLPATLESAVRSGIRSARGVLKSMRRSSL
ncbi:hydroxysqualene dehydroxylase HpnE [Kaarinaea lacus]